MTVSNCRALHMVLGAGQVEGQRMVDGEPVNLVLEECSAFQPGRYMPVWETVVCVDCWNHFQESKGCCGGWTHSENKKQERSILKTCPHLTLEKDGHENAVVHDDQYCGLGVRDHPFYQRTDSGHNPGSQWFAKGQLDRQGACWEGVDRWYHGQSQMICVA